MTRKRRKMSPAEVRCMIDYGSHDYELHETWLDYARNRARDAWIALQVRCKRSPDLLQKVALHERCRRCKRKVGL